MSSIERKTRKVINYLLSCKRTNNEIILGFKAYNSIEGITPQEFINILYSLQSKSLISVRFKGVHHIESPSFITISPELSTYISRTKRHKIYTLWSALRKSIAFWILFLAGISGVLYAIFTE